MNSRLLTAPLLATVLLLSTLGCSKKDGPAPDPAPTAGYIINTQNIQCKATCLHTTTSSGMDLLVVTLTTTPQPTGGPEVFTMSLTKQVSDPVSNYNPISSSRSVTNATGVTTTTYGTTTATLRNSTTIGKISGGFATYLTTPPTATITGGYFTDIQP